jgi:hypothetical protein
MKILSLGWGIQSTTIAFMVALGELEPIDVAIHADTTHESSLTYAFAKRWTPWLEARGVKVVTVKNVRPNNVSNYRRSGEVHIPAYTITPKGNGQTHRQCTGRWKIEPMRRWISGELKRLGIKKKPNIVEQWIGISWDESQRMKKSEVKYIVHRWPFLEKEHRMTRQDCEKWLVAHGLEVPPKSACVFCPFHSTAEWREILNGGNGDWHKAIDVDNEIRKAYPPYDLFVHPDRKPLEQVDLRTAEEKGQLALWDANGWDAECSGICGV